MLKLAGAFYLPYLLTKPTNAKPVHYCAGINTLHAFLSGGRAEMGACSSYTLIVIKF